mgnify:FL=1
MAVFVVVNLEVVNVNEQDCYLALADIDKLNFVINGALDGFTVIKTCKAVVACSFRKELFTLLCTVNINDNADNLSNVSISVTDSRSTEQYPDIVAVDILPAILVAFEFLAL